MPRNGSGTYSLPVGNPVVTGTTISSTWANNTLTDIANALTGSLTADGQTTASGNLNMGTNRIINMGDPSNAQDAATKYYVDQLIAALGTMAYQDADAVDITGGDIASVNIDLHSMTNEMYLPVGPTALRTATPIQGLIRFNTDGPFYEGYTNGNWVRFLTANEGSYTVTYVIVGGGAGGSGTYPGGGGGAGQFVASTTSVIPGTNVLTMTIGAGGAAGSNGSTSTITGVGQGLGGSASASAGVGGTSGNGYSGGGVTTSGLAGAGGGGGSSGNGSNGYNSESAGIGGNGGPGSETLITGVSNYYAGGGGGGGQNIGSSGGIGGGGAGNGGAGNGGNGTVNTGGGGGGTGANGSGNGGLGGSGIIYLSMPTVNYTGTTTGSPTVTTTGSNTVLKFTSSGTYTC